MKRRAPLFARTLSALGAILVTAAVAAGGLAAQTPNHNCSFCHNLHGGSYAALSDYAVVEDLCLSCHGDGGPATVDRDGTQVSVPQNGYAIHDGPKHSSPTGCWSCHNHEGEAGANLAMVPAQLETPNSGTRSVVFTAYTGTNSFGDGDSTYDGVCQVCHTATTYHLNTSLGAAHDVGTDCRACHTHSGGFQGAGSCVSCHSAGGAGTTGPNSRRDVMVEFGYTSHHMGVTADTTAACQSCHDQSNHKGGSVILFVQGGSSVTLSGDPLTNATAAAEAEAVCLSCHDETRPTDPFGDGIDPPLAATAAEWGAASHPGTGGATCFDCHASGHGSRKQGLLRGPGDYTTAANATTNYEAEEGFCFTCHTNGGAASTDIDAQFATPINWASDPWGENSVANFNDRHDVQHEASSVSGAKIECVNCHNPHLDTSAQPYLADPDPGNPAPVWSGQTAMSAFCIDCHDGTLPAGVQDHSPNPMHNIGSTWLTIDKMGGVSTTGEDLRDVFAEPSIGAGGGALEANPYATADILACETCHRPHPKAASQWPGTIKYDLFSLQDTVRIPDGRGISYYEVNNKGQVTLQTWDYGLTLDGRNATEETAGGYFCNTCHDRTGMNGKSTCGSSGCHSHGGGKF